MLLQLTAKHFCAGLIVQDGRVTVTAPILRYMMGWTLARVEEYAQAAGWTVTAVRAAAAETGQAVSPAQVQLRSEH